MKTKYLCPTCQKEFRFNITEVAEHYRTCKTKPAPAAAEAEAEAEAEVEAGELYSDSLPVQIIGLGAVATDLDAESLGGSNQLQTGHKRKLDHLDLEEPMQQPARNENDREPFECPSCLKTLMFTQEQAKRHLKRCSS